MSDLFARSLAMVDADGPRPVRVIWSIALVLIGVWLFWFFRAEIPVIVSTNTARVEVASAIHSIDAPADGTVLSVQARMGDLVTLDQPIIELTTRSEQLQKEEAELRARSARTSSRSLRDEIALSEAALSRSRTAASAAAAEIEARAREARELAGAADADARRGESLQRSGLLSEAERDRLRSEALRRRDLAVAQEVGLERFRAQQSSEDATRQAALEQLRSQLSTMEGTAGTSSVAAARLQGEIDRRIIRSPTSGRIAEEIRVRPGATVKVGDHLTSILPPGALILIAEFPASDAVGRIRAGQSARARLQGFSSIEYGLLNGRVSRVASEPVDGRLRVEIALAPFRSHLKLQHGMTATAEVDVESQSPAEMILRAAGKRMDAGASAGGGS